VRQVSAASAAICEIVVKAAPARTLAKTVDAILEARFDIDFSGDATQHYTSQISGKTWVVIGRNSGEDGA
jgi:hypothetical protein